MKPIYLNAIVPLCLLSITASRAQEVPQPIPPMTQAEKEKSLQVMAEGGFPQRATAEQIALHNQLSADAQRLISTGRKAYRECDYAGAVKAYEALGSNYNPGGRWELAVVYLSAGKTDKALESFRSTMYQKVQYNPRIANSLYGQYLSPRAILPGDAASGDYAQKSGKQMEVEVWASWDITAMGRFALLLASKNEYAEAIGVYEQAVRFNKYAWRTGWEPALSLGNITPTNFDRRRFEAAVYTMMGANYPSSYWSEMHHGKRDIKVDMQDRLAWLDQALRIKPDFAPALYMKADLMSSGMFYMDNSEAAYRTAKLCLDNAEKYARSGALRAQIQVLRKERASRLR